MFKIVLYIIAILLPISWSENLCCNSDNNVMNYNDEYCSYDNENDKINCDNDTTICQIKLLCGSNGTYNDEFDYYFADDKTDNFTIDNNDELILSQVDMFFYDKANVIPVDG